MRWPMSHPRASAFICLHLPASALDAFLLSLPRAAPCGKVARPPPASQNQLHREMPAEMAGLTHPEVHARRRHPMPSGTASPAPARFRRAPYRARQEAHAPIRRGTTMAGSNCPTRHKRLRAGWPSDDRPMAWRQEPMQHNGPARLAAGRADAIRGDTTPCPAVRPDWCRRSRALRTRCAANTPCPAGRLPGRRCPPSHPERDETMMRPARNRPGRQFS